MSNNRQLIIDCGSSGNESCELNKQSLDSINIHNQFSFAQYKYYLLFNNYLNKNCQLSLKAQTENNNVLTSRPNVQLKIFYHDQELFNKDLTSFFSEKVYLLTLPKQGTKLLLFEYFFKEFVDEFSIDYVLNFYLDCQQQSFAKQLNSTTVLGSETKQEEFRSVVPKTVINTTYTPVLFLVFSLLIFLFFLLLVGRFLKAKFTKDKIIN